MVSDLGVLSLFKYGDLFYSTSASLLAHVGVQVRYEPLNLLLPLGLSFVVCRAISLTVDVSRGVTGPGKRGEGRVRAAFAPGEQGGAARGAL